MWEAAKTPDEKDLLAHLPTLGLAWASLAKAKLELMHAVLSMKPAASLTKCSLSNRGILSPRLTKPPS